LRGFEKLNLLLTADDLRALKEAQEEYRRGETISHEELVRRAATTLNHVEYSHHSPGPILMSVSG